ncbi:MAG: MoxR family ATPase [Caldilineaceae bacterium]|nr:MoxR family ATPase [Caldilineaceae bacterium]
MEIVQRIAQRVKENVARVIVGKEEVVELLLVALFCEGHVLLEDVPGIGKTTLAKSLARSLGASFQRIQFTPDLLPSDITGVSIYNRKSDAFEYRAGPLMAGVVLADEINRAGPRTQSALLEAMEERQVTVDGVTHSLPYPFFLMATQNPVELEGTFPLPEAQMDRFLMQVALGYPEREEERQILRRFRGENPLADLKTQVTTDEIAEAVGICHQIHLSPALEDYLLDFVAATRADKALDLGISPRGSLALYRTSQALAAIRGRTYVLPDDIKQLVPVVASHRMILNSDARLRGQTVGDVLKRILQAVPVPVEELTPGRGVR